MDLFFTDHCCQLVIGLNCKSHKLRDNARFAIIAGLVNNIPFVIDIVLSHGIMILGAILVRQSEEGNGVMIGMK